MTATARASMSAGRCAAAALTFLVLAALGVAAHGGQALSEDDLWDEIRTGGAFVMMRHALAPGTGDPPGFDVEDCATQRNLSEEGRRQARAIGERFRKNGIAAAAVFTSAWCRCRETAELLGLGQPEVLLPLNSFFGRNELKSEQTQSIKSWLRNYEGNEPLVLVTHQVNITAMTGDFVSSGEMVVMRREDDGSFAVIGNL